MTYRFDISGQRLWDGARVGTIAHALWALGSPELAGEQSWSGRVYLLSDTAGALGAVAFDPPRLFGAFFEASSAVRYVGEDVQSLTSALPRSRRALQDEALACMLQEPSKQPIVSAVLGTQGEHLVAPCSWQTLMRNGGHLIERQVLPLARAVEAWQRYYGFGEGRTNLLLQLAQRRLAERGRIRIAAAQLSAAVPEITDGPPRYEAAAETLRMVGMQLELSSPA